MLQCVKQFYILLLVSLISSFPGFSQEGISVGGPFGNKSCENKTNLIKNGELLVVGQANQTCVLQKFDAKQNFAYKNEFVFPKKFEIHNVIELGNSVIMLYSHPLDKKDKLRTLFYVEIDFNKGEFLGTGKAILDKKEYFQVYHINNESFSVCHSSKDYQEGDKALRRYQSDVFDVNLKLISSAEIIDPYGYDDGEEFYNASVCSKSGSLYELYRLFPGGRTKKNDERLDTYLELVRSDLKSGEVIKTPIKFGKLYDGQYKYLGIQEGEDGTVSVAGNYYDNRKNFEDDIVDGFFLVNIDKQGNIKNSNLFKTTNDLAGEYLKPSELRKKEIKRDDLVSGYPDLVFKKLEKESDGSVLLVGEKRYVIAPNATGSPNDRGGSSACFYEDIILFKVDASGKLVWTKVLAKMQKGFRDPGNMSFSLIKDNQFYYFLFLDDKNNFGLTPGEKIKIHRDKFDDACLAACRVDIVSGKTTKLNVLEIRNVLGVEIRNFEQSRIVDGGSGSFFLNAVGSGSRDFLIKVDLRAIK
jgi:hypothetical protein